MSPLSHWLQLLQLPITRHQKNNLIKRFGSVSVLFESQEAWQFIASYCQEHQRELLQPQAYAEEAERLIERSEASGWRILTQEMVDFPESLRHIPDPPYLLFVRGTVAAVSEPQVAIVGSRKATPLGAKVAERFAKHLSDWGIGVVSGLALGIDTAAHTGALAGTTPTTAVLANGPGRIYPQRNSALAQQIVDRGGLLLTENPPGSGLDPWRFPERNRLIAGLALGTLVVEADLKSGSLVTAKLALSQGSEVFAVPGALSNPQARGCHQLIKQGAVLVESPDDILNALHSPLRQICGANSAPATALASDNPLVRALQAGALSLGELTQLSDLPVDDLQVELAKLELDGIVQRRAGRYYCSS